MKKILILTASIAFTSNLIAQQNVTVQNGLYFNQSGNHTDGLPYARFDESWGIRFNSPNSKWVLSSKPSVLIGYQPDGTDWGNDNLYVLGSIGVGTNSPNEKLEVNGNIRFSTFNQAIHWGTNTQFKITEHYGIELHGDQTHPIQILNSSLMIGYDQINVTNRGTGDIMMTGKMGIGTLTTASHRLAVEGSIGAREIKVEATGWSDFVFEKDYDLRTLEEVEQHIKEKGHLPEIPSEAEVTENGINLGEMNAKLLQKIEELTLYLIEQNKVIKELKDKVNLLENK